MSEPDGAPADRAVTERGSTFFAACPRNVSDLLATELREMDVAVEREHPAGVSFSGSLRDAYQACLRS
ncbi:MAG TPA: hypothetical protein VF055_13515, partial [Steroidobacteraceae bacterium]